MLLLLLVDTRLSLCQSSSYGFFHPQSINGNIKLKGLYREQKSHIGIVDENQKSTYFIGGVMLNTKSYLWAPDLVFINLDAEFNPETRKENYLLVPDRSEVRTLKKIDLRTIVFRNKPINLNAFVNLNQTYYNRELLTNIKSDSRQWGGLLSLNNKILPLSVSFRQSDWKQKELLTNRTFTMTQNNLLGRISKSFGESDKHEMLFSRDDYTYKYADSQEVKSLINQVSLNNNFYFDSKRKYSFNSHISYYDQAGDNEFNKLEAIERLMFNLPANLRFTGGYIYHRLNDPSQLLSQSRVNGSLTHRLYESLTSNVFMDFSGISHTIYDEKNLKAGFDINYTKKIPSGRINLAYRYSRSYIDMQALSAPVKVINEEHVLSDANITLLNKPYIDILTLIIKDQAGVIIYQLNFDYTVTVFNDYVEIQRVPGGQIADNQIINADYTAVQPGSYSFEADNNSFSSSIQLFKKLIELYYRSSGQDYKKLKETGFLTLNYYNQYIYGGRIDIGFAGVGVEYDEYKSNIIPYKRFRYYIDLNWAFRSSLLFSLNGNILDYKLIDDEVNQQHSNITGKISYKINQKTRIDLQAGYLSQNGRNIDLNLFTSRLEISSSLRQLYLKGGVEMYRREYLNSNFAFAGTYVELIRKF